MLIINKMSGSFQYPTLFTEWLKIANIRGGEFIQEGTGKQALTTLLKVQHTNRDVENLDQKNQWTAQAGFHFSLAFIRICLMLASGSPKNAFPFRTKLYREIFTRADKSFHDTKPTRIQLFWHLWSGEKIQGRRQQFFQNIQVTWVIHTDTSERKGRGNETEEEESQFFCFACQEILTNMPKSKVTERYK